MQIDKTDGVLHIKNPRTATKVAIPITELDLFQKAILFGKELDNVTTAEQRRRGRVRKTASRGKLTETDDALGEAPATETSSKAKSKGKEADTSTRLKDRLASYLADGPKTYGELLELEQPRYGPQADRQIRAALSHAMASGKVLVTGDVVQLAQQH